MKNQILRAQEAWAGGWLGRPMLAYAAPFLLFLGFLAVHPILPFGPRTEFVLRAVLLTAAIAGFSRPVLSLRCARPLGSVLVGIGVCALWLAPDLLLPAWRSHWLFTNPLTGKLASSVPLAQQSDFLLIGFRCLQAVVLVPIAEELFWRGWLARWLLDHEFDKVAFGVFTAGSFLITSVLFGLEHGPLWDVGLLAGITYNWWAWRTRRLGDCILAHAVTNACLSAYVLMANRWEYWS